MNRVIKFRAWDGEQMQSDFCLSSTGEAFQFLATIPAKLAEREDWKLMQFTGLLDKNGKEIYEGDVVAALDGKKSVIEYDAPNYIVRHIPEGGADFIAAKNYFEIIGNIYENPNLLP